MGRKVGEDGGNNRPFTNENANFSADNQTESAQVLTE